MPTITKIGTATPTHRHDQLNILNFMQQMLPLDETKKRLLSLLYHRSGIKTRYSVLADYSSKQEDFTFYPKVGEDRAFPNIERRMEVFDKTALDLSVKAIEATIGKDKISEITHLITVTCTGLAAPGLDLQLVEKLNMRPDIFRTSVNFMGCYAAIHALKLANSLAISSKNAKVLVVCTELCTLHFQNSTEIDQLTSALLFADGSAACLIESDEIKSTNGLQISNFFSKVIAKGKEDMAWGLSSTGFQMVLSNHIPRLVEGEIENLLSNALNQLDWKVKDVSHWAIHPGGKDILAATQKALSISKEDLVASYEVLKNYGNMSSPTILFVLKEIMQKAVLGERIFGAAFGPGLTLESFQLTAN
ncbi:MAG: putative naringenin-chalcone synthase [Spirosomataceae bacterium]|jgi:predicted naringenin-chalcone synthase